MAASRPAVRRLRALLFCSAALLASACAGDASRVVAPSPDDASARGGAPVVPTSGPAGTSALAGASLWVDPGTNAARTAEAWRATRPADAAQLLKIAAHSQVRWLGDWNVAVARDAEAATTVMTAAGAMPVFAVYNIPQRDCGGLSGNNSTGPAAYRTWIAGIAAGIGTRRAVVILEPDALAGMDCLSAADQQLRLDLLQEAVRTLRASGTIAVYLDAGNPAWHPAAVIADRLTRAGIAGTQGFALNVSNFLRTADNVAYGRKVSALVGGKHFVVDTGRNGAGGNGEWCNPAGRALGDRPTTATGDPLVDAYLWIKAPGESDGACGGAPVSGVWMPEYALGLAQRAAY